MWILCLIFVHLTSVSYIIADDVTIFFNADAKLDVQDSTTTVNTSRIQRFILNTAESVFSDNFEVLNAKNTSEPTTKGPKNEVDFTGEINIHCMRSTSEFSFSCKKSNQVLNDVLSVTKKYRKYFHEPPQSNKTNWPTMVVSVNFTINCDNAQTVKQCPKTNANKKSKNEANSGDTGKSVGLGVGLSVAAAAGLLIAAGILYRKCSKKGQVGSEYEQNHDSDDDNSSSGSSTTDSARSENINPFSAGHMPSTKFDKTSKPKFVRFK